jgi:hypothetical protein
VGGPPLTAHAFALLDNGIDRGVRRLQVCDGDELRPSEIVDGSLRCRWPDEQPSFTKFGCEPGKANVNRPVQMANSFEVLGMSDNGVFVPERARQRPRVLRDHEPLGIVERHSFGPLQIQEMPQRPFAEWDKRQYSSSTCCARQPNWNTGSDMSASIVTSTLVAGPAPRFCTVADGEDIDHAGIRVGPCSVTAITSNMRSASHLINRFDAAGRPRLSCEGVVGMSPKDLDSMAVPGLEGVASPEHPLAVEHRGTTRRLCRMALTTCSQCCLTPGLCATEPVRPRR